MKAANSHAAMSHSGPPTGRLAISVGLLGVVAMAPVSAQGTTARVVDGVRIVENPARRTASTTFALASRPSLDLGGLKTNPDHEFKANGGYLLSVQLSGGRHAVIDETRIHFFDPTGTHTGLTGRKGGGPGEFQQITGICRTRGDTLVVNDPTNGRVTVVDANGRIVRSLSVGHAELPWGGGCFEDGTFVVVVSAPSMGTDRYVQVVRRRLDGKIVNTIGPFWSSTSNRFLASSASVVAQGTKLFVSDPRVNEVKVYSTDGKLTARIRTADPIEQLTAAEKKALTPAFFARSTNSAANKAFNADQERVAARPSHWPSNGGISVDPGGRLWVTGFRKSRTDPYVYTGFDAEGRMLGNFSFPAATGPGDRLVVAFTATGVLVRSQDDDGAEHLMAFPLVAAR